MSDFQSKIIEVKNLLTDVNELLSKQKTTLDSAAESISKYGKNSKLPSDFSNAQKESIENSKKQSTLQKQIEENAKKQTAAIQRLTKEELNYIQAIERGVKSKEKEILANKKLNDAYGQLTAKRNEASRSLQNLIASETASNAEIRKAQKEFDILNKKVGQADKAVGKFSQANSGIKALTGSVSSLMGAFGIGTGIYLAVDIAKNIYETTKQLQSLDLALKMVSGTQEEFSSNQAFISGIAEKWGIEIKGLTEQYTQFYTASKGILSTAKIKEVFESIAKSGALMGLSVDKQNASFYAFEQMMSKGVVTSEELKKQLGNAMPGAMKAAGMAYMELHPKIKTIQEAEAALMSEMKKGAIDSATYVPLIVKNFEKLYGIENVNKVETLQTAQERLANSWTELVKSMNESKTSGIGSFFTFMIAGLKNGLDLVTRMNTSWDELYKKAGVRGKQLGSEEFEKRFNSAGFTTSTEKEKAEMVLSKARNELINLRKKESEIDSSIKNTIVKFGSGYDGLKEQKEKISLGIAGLAEIIRLSRIKAGLDKDTSKIVDTPVVGESEKERKAREKREKEEAKEREQKLKDLYDAELSNLKKKQELAEDAFEGSKGLEDKKVEFGKTFRDKEFTEYELDINKRVELAMKLAKTELDVLKFTHKEKLRLADKEAKERGLNQAQTITLKTPIENVFSTDKMNLVQNNAKRVKDIYKDYFNSMDNLPKDLKLKVPGMWTKEEIKANEKAQKKALDSRKQALKDNAKLFNEFFGDFASKSGFSQTFDNFFKENKEGVSLIDKMFDKDATMSAEERTLATFQVISSAAQDTMNLIMEASNARFENERNNLEKQKEIAIGFAGESDAAKKKIEEDYEKRKKEIDRREFKAKQKQAMVNIAIDTAQAIAATIGKTGFFGIPLSVIVGALGAAQLAMVASQKMPEYWMGTDNAQEGLAWTQERGAEIITDKKGNIKDFGSNKGARLTKMTAGDKVFTAEQTKRLMFNEELNSIMTNNNIFPPKIEVNSSGLSASEMRQIMNETIGNMQTQNISIDGDGLHQYVTNGNSRTISKDNRVSGRGIIV